MSVSPTLRDLVPPHDTHIAGDPVEIVQIINERELKNYRLGIFLLFIAVSTWIIGLELVNVVLKGDDYNKPWLFSVITGSCFILNFTPDVIRFCKRFFDGQSDVESVKSKEKHEYAPEELSRREVSSLAFQIAIIYYFYNLFVMEALQYTSASNQTVLGSTTSIFTLIMGVCLRIDKFTLKKFSCVMISTVGVFLVNYSESTKENDGGNMFQPKNAPLGNCLALFGAFMYTLYLNVMKVKCGGDRTTNERQLFGFVGVYTLLLGIPILVLVDALEIEKLEPPPTRGILVLVLVNGVFSVISDYTTILAMLLTSPLVTSLSLTSSIPITICIDFVVIYFTEDDPDKHISKGFLYFLGIASVLLSVILINVNLTTETEFIEHVIEDALEEAIKEDEVLSPILSPLLDTRADSTFLSPLLQASQRQYKVGIKGSDILARLSPAFVASTANVPRPKSTFNLNATSDDQAPLFNTNHSQTLYTIDSAISNEETGFIVYSGDNHRYQVRPYGDNNE